MNKLSCFLLTLTAYVMMTCTVRTYYVVRHADRPENGADQLTAPGKIRALVLADSLRNKQIRHVFSTRFERTRRTATPLSEAIAVPIAEYSVDTLPLFGAHLRRQRNSLIVGHSDSILQTVQALGASSTVTSIGPREFDRLFIVTRKRQWFRPVRVSLIETRYGAVAQ